MRCVVDRNVVMRRTPVSSSTWQLTSLIQRRCPPTGQQKLSVGQRCDVACPKPQFWPFSQERRCVLPFHFFISLNLRHWSLMGCECVMGWAVREVSKYPVASILRTNQSRTTTGCNIPEELNRHQHRVDDIKAVSKCRRLASCSQPSFLCTSS